MRMLGKTILFGVLLAELTAGVVWAQSGASGAKDIDIIVRKKPSGQNMACISKGKPCNVDQVNELSTELSKTGVSVVLAAPSGALRCTTPDGKECTDEYVGQVKKAARAIRQKEISETRSGRVPAAEKVPSTADKTASEKQMAQRERMKECNEKAGDQKGDERKKFMSTCLKGDKPSDKQMAQREKMKTCNKEASDKKLAGKERKEFMSSCLAG